MPTSTAASHFSNSKSKGAIVSVPRTLGKIVWLAIPMALSYTFCFSIVSIGILIGHLARAEKDPEKTTDYLAASTLITTYVYSLAAITVGCLFSISLLTSNELGQLRKWEDLLKNETENLKNSERLDLSNISNLELIQKNIIQKRIDISRTLRNGLIIGGVIIPPSMVVLYFSKFILVNLCKQKDSVAEIAQTYLRSYAFAIPGVVFFNCLQEELLAFEKQIPAMLMGLSTFAVGTTTAAFLSLGYYQLGIPGIAYGYVANMYLATLAFGGYLVFGKTFRNFNFFSQFKFNRKDWQQIKSLIKIGAPISLQLGCEMTLSVFLGMLCGWLGKDELAAQNFSSQFGFFAFIPLFALGQAVSQQVSREIGAQSYFNAHRFIVYGLLVSGLVIGPLALGVSVFPNVLTSIITNSITDKVMDITRYLIPITASGVFFDALRYNMVQTLRGANDLNIPTIMSIISLWLGLAAAYFLGFNTRWGIYGVAAGYTAGTLLAMALVASRWVIKTRPEVLEKVENERRRIKEAQGDLLLRDTSLELSTEFLPVSNSNTSSCWGGFFSRWHSSTRNSVRKDNNFQTVNFAHDDYDDDEEQLPLII